MERGGTQVTAGRPERLKAAEEAVVAPESCSGPTWEETSEIVDLQASAVLLVI